MGVRRKPVRRMRGRLRGQSIRGRGVRAPFHKPGDQLDGFLAKGESNTLGRSATERQGFCVKRNRIERTFAFR
jgi:hypothetical protein